MDGESGQHEGKFNMGVATLERIHVCLEKIRWCFEYLSGVPRQRFHIDEVKILFMNAAPLLEEEMVKKYEEEIDGLKLKTKVSRGKSVIAYDFKLEARLFKIVREWELKLTKYFMPKKSDFKGL
jgi:hypothetical protein